MAPSTRIRTFFKPHIFFVLIRVDGAINRLWRAVSKQFGFGDQIHWFLVGGAGRFVYKMYAVSKYIHTRVTRPKVESPPAFLGSEQKEKTTNWSPEGPYIKCFVIQSTLSETDTLGTCSMCPSQRDVCQIGSKERQGPTLSVPFTEVSVTREQTVFLDFYFNVLQL